MDKYKITASEVEQNNVKSAPTHIYGSDPVENKHIFDKLPELIVNKFNSFISAFNGLLDEKLKEHDIKLGNGDMLQAVYDADGDGIVDKAKSADEAEKLGGCDAEYFASAEAVQTAQQTAEAAMPKSGGTFTGDAVAYSTNRTTSSLRNIEVRTSSATGTLQSTDKIIMVRK